MSNYTIKPTQSHRLVILAPLQFSPYRWKNSQFYWDYYIENCTHCTENLLLKLSYVLA